MPAKTKSSKSRMSRTKTRRSVTKPVTKSKSTSKRTTDHKEIMKWAENRGGQPAAVKRTRGSKETGLIRIDFPGYSGSKSLEHISWDDFFKKFDKSKLQLVYQDKTKDGKKSRFNRLVKIKK